MAVHLKVKQIDAIRDLNQCLQGGVALKNSVQQEYDNNIAAQTWKTQKDALLKKWEQQFQTWATNVHSNMKKIYEFPDGKWDEFKSPPSKFGTVSSEVDYKYATTVGGISRRIEILNQQIKKVEELGETVSISVHGSPGAIVNTGSIEGNINSNISIVQTKINPDLADAFKVLTDVIHKETSDEIDKEALLKQVEILSQQACIPAAERKQTKVAAAWDYLSKFTTVTSIGEFLAKYGPLIAGFFQLS